jgi:hypothetical protein
MRPSCPRGSGYEASRASRPSLPCSPRAGSTGVADGRRPAPVSGSRSGAPPLGSAGACVPMPLGWPRCAPRRPLAAPPGQLGPRRSAAAPTPPLVYGKTFAVGRVGKNELCISAITCMIETHRRPGASIAPQTSPQPSPRTQTRSKARAADPHGSPQGVVVCSRAQRHRTRKHGTDTYTHILPTHAAPPPPPPRTPAPASTPAALGSPRRKRLHRSEKIAIRTQVFLPPPAGGFYIKHIKQ